MPGLNMCHDTVLDARAVPVGCSREHTSLAASRMSFYDTVA